MTIEETLKKYMTKTRHDALVFLDQNFPKETQEQKEIYLYSIYKNAEIVQNKILKEIYGLDIENEETN
jgi:uncharacterized protein YozE (UPF0346 family)